MYIVLEKFRTWLLAFRSAHCAGVERAFGIKQGSKMGRYAQKALAVTAS